MTRIAIPILLFALTACGDSARAVQLDIAHGGAIALNTATDLLTAAREREMDAAEEAHPNDPEHDAAIDAVAERWEPVAVAVDAARAALIEWITEAAAAHDDSVSTIARIVSYAHRLVALYERIRSLAGRLDVELPAIPRPLLDLLGDPAASENTARSVVEDIRSRMIASIGLPEVS